jgi:hypothetical protein
MNFYRVNVNGFDVLIDKQPTSVAICHPKAKSYQYMRPEQAEALAAALLAAAKVARENEAKNGNQANTKADNQTR